MAVQELQRTYNQLCPVAVSLDLVGDRWTLLLLRDLLWHGPMRFRQLEERNPGLSTSLLTARLRDLTRAGLVERVGDARGHYRLTEAGRAIRHVVDALYTFGAPLLARVPLRPAMLAYVIGDIAQRRRPELLRLERSATVRLDVDGVQAVVSARPGALELTDEQEVEATLRCSQGAFVKLVAGSGELDDSLASGAAAIDGDVAAVRVVAGLLKASG